MKFSEPREKVPTSDPSDPSLLQNKCGKFNPFYKANADNKRAILYLKLVKSGCPKPKALRFASKNICRIDSTKTVDGPNDFKILKVKPSKNYSHKVKNLFFFSYLQKGWLFKPPNYDLGKEYFQETDEFLKSDDQEDLLNKHFIMNENKIREDFKKKIELLAKYYKELNDDYGFTNLPESELYKKVKALSEKNKGNIAKHFVKLGDNKLFNVGEELFKDKTKPNRFNILNELNIFPSAGNPYEKQLEVESEEESESENEESPTLNTWRSPKNLASARKLFASSRKSRLQYIHSKDPAEIENVKRRSTVLYALEVQTHYLSKLANIETIMDNSYYTNSELKLLNKKSSSPGVKKKEGVPTIIDNFGKETQKFMEEEFNQSKYITSKKSNDSKNKKEIKTPLAFRFKRKSYLSEAITKDDMNDPIAFEYALKKIIHTHVEKMNKIKNGNGENIDTRNLDAIKSFRKKTQDLYFNRSTSASTFRIKKNKPLSQTTFTKYSQKDNERADAGFLTSRTVRNRIEDFKVPHIRLKTALN